MQVALAVLAMSVVAVWASVANYRQGAPAPLVFAPPPLKMACAAGCGLGQ